MTEPTLTLSDLAAECVLKQANAKWESRTILTDYFQQAYQLGYSEGYSSATKDVDLCEEGGS